MQFSYPYTPAILYPDFPRVFQGTCREALSCQLSGGLVCPCDRMRMLWMHPQMGVALKLHPEIVYPFLGGWVVLLRGGGCFFSRGVSRVFIAGMAIRKSRVVRLLYRSWPTPTKNTLTPPRKTPLILISPISCKKCRYACCIPLVIIRCSVVSGVGISFR